MKLAEADDLLAWWDKTMPEHRFAPMVRSLIVRERDETARAAAAKTKRSATKTMPSPKPRKAMRAEKPEHRRGREAFHAAVFAAHGDRCYFGCGRAATDAMHVVPRSQLTQRTRYAAPAANGRSGCRRCHKAQESGAIAFPLNVRLGAVRALNHVPGVRVLLPEPDA